MEDQRDGTQGNTAAGWWLDWLQSRSTYGSHHEGPLNPEHTHKGANNGIQHHSRNQHLWRRKKNVKTVKQGCCSALCQLIHITCRRSDMGSQFWVHMAQYHHPPTAHPSTYPCNLCVCNFDCHQGCLAAVFASFCRKKESHRSRTIQIPENRTWFKSRLKCQVHIIKTSVNISCGAVPLKTLASQRFNTHGIRFHKL